LLNLGDFSKILLNFFKLKILIIFYNKQTVGAKIHSQEGKSPDYKLRSLNIIK